MDDLSVIILNYNTKELILKCLKSILDKKWQHKVEVIVVDNGSNDGSKEAVRKRYPFVKLIPSRTNLGFAGGNNLGLKKSRTKYCLLLNSDTEVLDGALDKLVNFGRDRGFEICSCKLLNTDKSFQPNAGSLPSPFFVFLWLSGIDDLSKKIGFNVSYQARDKGYYLKDREVGWVSGTAMLIRSDIFKKIGFLDKKIFMYGEDVEYCMRANRSGFRVGWTNEAEIIHIGGGSWDQPKYNQWLGEFRGLLYIYKKYYGFWAKGYLKILIYIFSAVRIIAFLLFGKLSYARTYAKIITKI